MRILVATLLAATACGSKSPPHTTEPPRGVENHAATVTPDKAAVAPQSDERVQALVEVDAANPRSVDKALRAAEALGDAKAPAGIQALIALANRPPDRHLIAAQIAAIRALGKYPVSDAIVSGLVRVVERPLQKPSEVETEPSDGTGTAMAMDEGNMDVLSLHLATKGAAVNALAELRSPAAVKPLVLAMYRTPQLMMQIRRALVAIGPASEQEALRVMRGESAEVKQAFAAEHIDRYCGEDGHQTCQPVSARDFYAAIVVGDFYDPASVPVLLAALKQPALPSYYVDDTPSPSTQHNAIFDALRKIGTPDAAAPVRAMWMGGQKSDPMETALAIATYAFVTRDGTGTDELAKIAADNSADDNVRQEAATAYARLAHDDKAIEPLIALSKKYLDASAKKAKEAAPKRKAAEAADKVFAAKKQALEQTKKNLLAIMRDSSKSAADIKAASVAAKKEEEAFKLAKKKHHEQVMPFKQLDSAAKAYLGYARMFQTHVGRIEVAIRCKADLACYAATLKETPADAVDNTKKYIAGVDTWTAEEKADLLAAEIDRAMLELGKSGAKASAYTDALLDATVSEHRLIRQAVLLALPKIAPLPCTSCVTKLDAAIKAGAGKETLVDLQIETEVARNYFRWAGTK
jgi:hypothetical protein